MAKEITARGKDRRDTKEILDLAALYLPYVECVGGHIVHKNYVCPWCESDQPSRYCVKEKVGWDG